MIKFNLPQKKLLRFLFFGYWIILFFLFLYSFTQIDLSLTLSKFSIWQIAEKFFQHIGYFNRPLSTVLFIIITLFLFVFYLLFLRLTSLKKINEKELLTVIYVSTIILVFSYNAFSYDLFNYIFDAKIVTYYHQNPYLHKALDFPLDPMLSFMRWTHRVYPYGIVWLLLTVPLSFIGFQYFLLTFFLFKILMASGFLISVYFLNKILKKVLPNHSVVGLALFSLNPLVLIESLVSAHNDIVMIAFFLVALYFFLARRIMKSIFWFIISIGIKFGTLFFTPVFTIIYFDKNKKGLSQKALFLFFLCALFPIFFASIRSQFQPWYLLYILPIVSLMPRRYFVVIPTIIVTLFALFEYIPYLYLGNWNPPVPNILNTLTASSILISCMLVLVMYIKNKVWK